MTREEWTAKKTAAMRGWILATTVITIGVELIAYGSGANGWIIAGLGLVVWMTLYFAGVFLILKGLGEQPK